MFCKPEQKPVAREVLDCNEEAIVVVLLNEPDVFVTLPSRQLPRE